MNEITPSPWVRKDTACFDSEGEYCGTEYWVIGPDGEELACPDLPGDADMIAAAPAMLAVLLKLEWRSGVDVACRCPWCDGWKHTNPLYSKDIQGHDADCELAAAIALAKGVSTP